MIIKRFSQIGRKANWNDERVIFNFYRLSKKDNYQIWIIKTHNLSLKKQLNNNDKSNIKMKKKGKQ